MLQADTDYVPPHPHPIDKEFLYLRGDLEQL